MGPPSDLSAVVPQSGTEVEALSGVEGAKEGMPNGAF
jgi:hypothetical protein